MKKTSLLLLLIAILAAAAVSCEKEAKPNSKIMVLLPSNDTTARWAADSAYISEELIKAKAEFSIYMTNEDIGSTTQAQLIDKGIKSGCRNFIVTPIDYYSINSLKVFEGRTDAHVVCHDRLIYDNVRVSYFSSCDPYTIGSMQGQFLADAFEASGKSSMTLEMFSGPTVDLNAILFYSGAYSVLRTYIDSGKMVVKSERLLYAQTCLSSWLSSDARKVFGEILAKYYPSGTYPDLVLASNDNIAIGCVQALRDKVPSITKFPVITAQDNSPEVKAYIDRGEISMTIDKSIKTMCSNSVAAILSLMKNIAPPAPYYIDNGAKQVPYISSVPVIVTK